MSVETTTREFTELDRDVAVWKANARKLTKRRLTTDDRSIDKPISPGRESLISADIRFLSPILKELGELRDCAEDDEYGTLRATKFAYDVACHLLIDAAIFAAPDRQIPSAVVSTDSEGGIRVQWIRPKMSVRLVVPFRSDKDSYIYHEIGSECGIVEPATAEVLAHRLASID